MLLAAKLGAIRRQQFLRLIRPNTGFPPEWSDTRRVPRPRKGAGIGRWVQHESSQRGRVPSREMTDLFSARADDLALQAAPLATRMRPRRIEEVAGQPALLGPDAAFRLIVESGR